MSEYSDFGMVEQKLRDGMYEGNMHACLRNVGRIAGGCLAAGRLTQAEIDALGDIAVSLSLNKAEGRRKWEQSVQFGSRQPLERSVVAHASPDASNAIGWDEVVSPDEYRIVDTNWLETEVVREPDKWSPCAQLREYLSALFEPY